MDTKKNSSSDNLGQQSVQAKTLLAQFHEALGASGQMQKDAEARSKATCIRYCVSYGASLRKKLNLSRPAKIYTALTVLLLYCLIESIGCNFFNVRMTDPIVVGFLVLGGLLCTLATLLAPEDLMYLDRLSLIIPERNMLTIQPKTLWAKVEEINIVDIAKSGKPSQFVLQLKQVSGDATNIYLSALTHESLQTLVSYIRQYAPHMRGLAQLHEVDRFYDYQNGTLPNISYTQLWESASKAHFGLTSFTPLAPLTRIQNQFAVVKQIAAGGFSAIYLIQDDDGLEFILKESVLPSTLDEVSKAKALEQFQREATILAKLNHKQIARVHDHFVEHGRNYLRLEYIQGPNMRQYLSDSHSQPESVCLSWTKQLAEILTYLHSLTPPVVHRDLSPDNIVVCPDGKLVLIDFGAANEFIGQATGTLVGKHAYMAPEQIRGNAQPVSDVYALGACTYFALTGHDPEPIKTLSAKKHGVAVSQWLDTFMTRCTQLDKEERFTSSEQCLDYLTLARTDCGQAASQ